MPKLTHDQLHQWYAQLKTALYEQVNVNLDRKEDLGRIRIMRINDLHHENPDLGPDVDMIYPFIPHRPLNQGEVSSDPLLSYYRYDPPAPPKEDTETYHQWLLDSVSKTQLTDDLIQEMYDMSVDGQLMVFNGSKPGTHQIQTQNGQITVTANHDDIQFETNPPVVEPPRHVGPEVPDPPAEKPEPGPAPKGFLIRLRHFFGGHTVYTDYVNRKKAYEQYRRELTVWENTCTQKIQEWEATQAETTYEQNRESFRQQMQRFNEYLGEFSKYYVNPLNRFDIAFRFSMEKIRRLDENKDDEPVYNQRVAEDLFWDQLHQNTPLGKMQTIQTEATQTHRELREMREAVEAAFAPKYKTGILNFNGIIGHHNNVKPYAPPVMKNGKISDKNAAWICMVFLADPTVLAEDPEGADMDLLNAQERYQKIMDTLLLKGEQNNDHLFTYIQAARVAGANAMKEYALGKPENLAIMLGNCIRRQNQLTDHQTDAYSLKSYCITSALLEALDANPDLMENCMLTADELQLARTNATTYQVNMIGLSAKANLLGHALHQNNLDEPTLRAAAADMLLMNTINAQVAKNQHIHLKPEEIQQHRQALRNHPSVDQLVKMNREELGKAIVLPREQLEQLPQIIPEVPKPQIKPIEPQIQVQTQQQMYAAPSSYP